MLILQVDELVSTGIVGQKYERIPIADLTWQRRFIVLSSIRILKVLQGRAARSASLRFDECWRLHISSKASVMRVPG
jgi:hypothetical protein